VAYGHWNELGCRTETHVGMRSVGGDHEMGGTPRFVSVGAVDVPPSCSPRMKLSLPTSAVATRVLVYGSKTTPVTVFVDWTT
jgi:hypothetical protein